MSKNGKQTINELETILYKKLGKGCFVFIKPDSIDPTFTGQLPKFISKIRKKLKNQKNKALVDQFITEIDRLNPNAPQPILLEAEKEKIPQDVYKFLQTQNTLQQLRWMEAVPKYSVYGIEFFLPPMTESEIAQLKALDHELLKMEDTFSVDLPFALVKNSQGLFDPQATIDHETQYFLIRSALSAIGITELASRIFARELIQFPKWAFFSLNHQDELSDMAQRIIQTVYDYMMQFAYSQMATGISPTETTKNAIAYLNDSVHKKELEDIPVIRTDKIRPLSNYVLGLLNELRAEHPYIKGNTIKDFYPHIFHSLEKVLDQGLIVPGTFLDINIRDANNLEREKIGNTYTMEIMQILANGTKLDNIKEYYQVILTTSSMQKLIEEACDNRKMGYYFI